MYKSAVLIKQMQLHIYYIVQSLEKYQFYSNYQNGGWMNPLKKIKIIKHNFDPSKVPKGQDQTKFNETISMIDSNC